MKDLHIVTYPKFSLEEIQGLKNEGIDLVVMNYGGDDNVQSWSLNINNSRQYHYCFPVGHELSGKDRNVNAHQKHFDSVEDAEDFVLKIISGEFNGQYANILITDSDHHHVDHVVEEVVEDVEEDLEDEEILDEEDNHNDEPSDDSDSDDNDDNPWVSYIESQS